MIADSNTTTASGAKQQIRISDEATAVTPFKPPHAAAPGKKWAKVKKTEQSMDDKGYMCFKDVEVWEEVEDVRAAARKTAGAKLNSSTTQAAGVP